jgi:uncharacterized Tic20 family protein
MHSDQPESLPQSRERVWATFCHLAALTPLLGIPFGLLFGRLARVLIGLIAGPLVVWLIKKDESPFVNRHGKAALNFQISMILYGVLLIGFGFVCLAAVYNADPGRFNGVPLVVGHGRLPAPVVMPLRLVPIVLGVLDLVSVVVGAVRANKGREYRYPLAIPFIR